MKMFKYAAVAAVALVPATAIAGPKEVSGSSNGLTWAAASRIVGQTSTATVAGGGNPIYLAPNAAGYSGTVGLLMEYDNNTAFVCSGTLTRGNSIVTAAHCVSDGFASNVAGRAAGLVKTTAFFYDQAASVTDNPIYNGGAGITEIEVSRYYVNSGYTGEVIDQNDIAILRLGSAAPDYAQVFDIYDGGDLTGEGFNMAGFGRRSDAGGSVGSNLGTGRRRQGDNVYDYAWGNSAFGGFFTDEDANGENFFGTADIEFSYVSDFDRLGSPNNNQSCFIAQAVTGMTIPGFCGQAVGALESGVAGGDSGGSNFIDGKLAGVNSYGLTFGASFGDSDGALNNSFGEFSGYVPTFIHTNFINGAVPEPSTWALLILGFGVAGASMRRKNKVQLAHAF